MVDDHSGKIGTDTSQKLLAAVSLVALNAAVLEIGLSPPATGYELSLYDALPQAFFIFYILSFITALVGMVWSAKNKKTDAIFRILMITSLLLIFLLILLPFLRGYEFYGRDDNLTHIGIIKDILRSGHLGLTNFYPVLHIVASILFIITGMQDLFIMREVMTPVFYALYIVGIYFVTKIIIKKKGESAIAAVLATLPVLASRFGSFTTSDLMFFMVPMLLFLYYLNLEHNKPETKALFLFGLLLVPYMHPEIVIFLIGIFLLFHLLTRIPQMHSETYSSVSLSALFIVFLSFFIWFLNFSNLFQYFRRVYRSIVLEVSIKPIDSYSSLLARSQLTFSEFLDLLIKKEGAILILLLVGFIIVIFLAKRLFNRKRVDVHSIFFGLLYCCTGMMVAVSLFFDVVVSFDRVLKFAVLASTLLICIAGITYFRFNPNSGSSNIHSLAVAVFLAICIILLGPFSAYASPIIRSYNQQVSTTEFSGIYWLIEKGDRSVEPLEMLLYLGRFVHAKEGYDYSLNNDPAYALVLYGEENAIPDHFSYMEHSTFGESFSERKYILTHDLMKQFYFVLWPKHARFDRADFVRIDRDPSLDKIYGNGNLDVRFIY